MAQTIIVTIIELTTLDAPPSTVLEYEVRNEGDSAVWVVDDGWMIWGRHGREIELSFARGRMRAGSQPFGYFDPEVIELGASERMVRSAHLTWPQPLDRLWNDEPVAAPAPGEYEVSVRVGFGETPKPAPPHLGEGVEAPVLRWQREAVSAPVRMRVPAYAP
jgi:hypothetical protein